MTTRKVVDLAEARQDRERDRRINDFVNTLSVMAAGGIEIEKKRLPDGLKANSSVSSPAPTRISSNRLRTLKTSRHCSNTRHVMPSRGDQFDTDCVPDEGSSTVEAKLAHGFVLVRFRSPCRDSHHGRRFLHCFSFGKQL